MSILDGFKTCRKGLHKYSAEKRRCPECQKEAKKLWAELNPEKNKKAKMRWRERNREKEAATNKKWQIRNKKKRRETAKHWREKNLTKVKEASKKWRNANPDVIAAYDSKRRARELCALPSWANFAAIKDMYKYARELTASTGIIHHVDHIYPLQSKYMCGLHVETNLQILTAEENARKGNRTWPGQLDCQKD